MAEFYFQIKMAHIGFVLASGATFALRGLLLQLGQSWVMAKSIRYLSIGIDTLLLVTALMLLSILHLNPFTTDWLATKLILLVVYILLGVMALRRAEGRGKRLFYYLAALVTFGFIYSVARAHHPLGIFLTLGA